MGSVAPPALVIMYLITKYIDKPINNVLPVTITPSIWFLFFERNSANIINTGINTNIDKKFIFLVLLIFNV